MIANTDVSKWANRDQAPEIVLFAFYYFNMAADKPEKEKNDVQKQFGSVIITLENCILPSGKLYSTPSVYDGLDLDTETDLRILGCEFIQTAGILLKLPQVSLLFIL